jgi:hypothetical protein
MPHCPFVWPLCPVQVTREGSDTNEGADGLEVVEAQEPPPSSPSIQEKELKASSQPSNTNGNTSGSNESNGGSNRYNAGSTMTALHHYAPSASK